MVEREKTWAWLMPGGKIYRVVTNPVEGRISVYHPDGRLVKRYERLSEAAVRLIEQNFLGTVATLVSGKETKDDVVDEIAMYIR
ncbi:MAG: hypothetical protein ACXQTW_02885 [Candidatus Methanospirareceae archaeon]